MSYADERFIQNCRDILTNGVWDTELEVRPHWEDGTPAHTVKKFGIINRYDLREEFPILTLRRTYFKTCIDELLWIWQQKSNNIHDLRGHIWDSWADGTGSIGKAYGYQLAVKHQYPEGEFNQVDRVLYDLKQNPASRRIMTNIYNFQDLHEMALYPCAPPMTKASSPAASSIGCTSWNTSAPSGARFPCRDSTRFRRPGRPRPPGRDWRVRRPMTTVWPMVRALKRRRSALMRNSRPPSRPMPQRASTATMASMAVSLNGHGDLVLEGVRVIALQREAVPCKAVEIRDRGIHDKSGRRCRDWRPGNWSTFQLLAASISWLRWFSMAFRV